MEWSLWQKNLLVCLYRSIAVDPLKRASKCWFFWVNCKWSFIVKMSQFFFERIDDHTCSSYIVSKFHGNRLWEKEDIVLLTKSFLGHFCHVGPRASKVSRGASHLNPISSGLDLDCRSYSRTSDFGRMQYMQKLRYAGSASSMNPLSIPKPTQSITNCEI